jgi:hypothetical protein
MLSDSVNENVATLTELLRSIPPQARHRARTAATSIEKVVNDLRKDYPRDPAVALGTAWALAMMLDRMIQSDTDRGGGDESLIQLL